jgi:hypothetical protein
MENVLRFYDHLEYFMAICYNLWPFGIVCGNLVYFLRFGMFGPRKIWQPWSGAVFGSMFVERKGVQHCQMFLAYNILPFLFTIADAIFEV